MSAASNGDYGWLDQFAAEAAPRHQFAPGLESVADGDYECQFGSCKMDRINQDHVVRCTLRLLSAGGREVELVYWLNKQVSVNDYLAEMLALGFPANTWGARAGQVPLSVAIPDCVRQLEGVHFRARKSSRIAPARPAEYGRPAQEERTFHSLFIAGRISGQPMSQRPAQAQPAPVAAPTGSNEDIPF